MNNRFVLRDLSRSTRLDRFVASLAMVALVALSSIVALSPASATTAAVTDLESSNWGQPSYTGVSPAEIWGRSFTPTISGQTTVSTRVSAGSVIAWSIRASSIDSTDVYSGTASAVNEIVPLATVNLTAGTTYFLLANVTNGTNIFIDDPASTSGLVSSGWGWSPYYAMVIQTQVTPEVAIANTVLETATNSFSLSTSGVGSASQVTYSLESGSSNGCLINNDTAVLSSANNATCLVKATVTAASGATIETAVKTFSFTLTADPPTTLTVSPRNREVQVSWVAPVGLSVITGYKVEVQDAQSNVSVATSGCSPQVTGTSLLTSCTIGGLPNGQYLKVRVTTKNGETLSTPTQWSALVAPRASAPGQPQSPAATRANASSSVSWMESSYDAGAPTSGYRVLASAGGSQNFVTVATQAKCLRKAGLAQSCTIIGLVNGVPYRFKVIAHNIYGAGPSSESTAAVTPATLPAAAAKPLATLGSNEATLRWNAPISDGGSAITGYVVQRASKASGPWSDATASCGRSATTSTTTPSCEATWLETGASYYFRVAAVTALGQGPWSPVSSVVRGVTAPGIPRTVAVTALVKSLRISWLAPLANGGTGITGYSIEVSDASGLTFTRVTAGTCATAWKSVALSCTINGPTNTAYVVRVRAINAIDEGEATSSSALATMR
jgi:hypothetical protein